MHSLIWESEECGVLEVEVLEENLYLQRNLSLQVLSTLGVKKSSNYGEFSPGLWSIKFTTLQMVNNFSIYSVLWWTLWVWAWLIMKSFYTQLYGFVHYLSFELNYVFFFFYAQLKSNTNNNIELYQINFIQSNKHDENICIIEICQSISPILI